MIRIIDNKKIELTNDEWLMYERICKSYDRPNQNGEELFKDLFESDENGVILFLKPPSNRSCTMEIFLFFVSVMTQQHLRVMYNVLDNELKSLRKKVEELSAK